MAIYTALRVKVKIKEEYLKDLIILESLGWDWSESENILFKHFGCFSSFSADHFPIGKDEIPEEWIKDKKDFGVDSEYLDIGSNLDVENRIWSFQTAIKSYSAGEEDFLNDILMFITEEVIELNMYKEGTDTFKKPYFYISNISEDMLDEMKKDLIDYEYYSENDD